MNIYTTFISRLRNSYSHHWFLRKKMSKYICSSLATLSGGRRNNTGSSILLFSNLSTRIWAIGWSDCIVQNHNSASVQNLMLTVPLDKVLCHFGAYNRAGETRPEEGVVAICFPVRSALFEEFRNGFNRMTFGYCFFEKLSFIAAFTLRILATNFTF